MAKSDLYGGIAAVGGGLGAIGDFASGSAARRAADNRATALKAAASRRLEQGKQQADILKAQGQMSQTSEFSSQLGRGISREDVFAGGSLMEIANRAKFASDQALEQSQIDANSILQDAQAVEQEGRNAQEAGVYKGIGSILSTAALFA